MMNVTKPCLLTRALSRKFRCWWLVLPFCSFGVAPVFSEPGASLSSAPSRSQALGITIPVTLINRADQLIE